MRTNVREAKTRIVHQVEVLCHTQHRKAPHDLAALQVVRLSVAPTSVNMQTTVSLSYSPAALYHCQDNFLSTVDEILVRQPPRPINIANTLPIWIALLLTPFDQ